MLYFIADETNRAIKIGHANDPDDRCRELQVGSPHLLRILGVIPGGKPEEARLHRRFAPHRIRGEWFDFAAISETVLGLIERYGIQDRLPGTPEILYNTKAKGKSFPMEGVDWKQVQHILRQHIYRLTGIACEAYWGGEPFVSGCETRAWSTQIMPDDEHHPFWGWHFDNNPQWYSSPGTATDAWTTHYAFWKDRVA